MLYILIELVFLAESLRLERKYQGGVLTPTTPGPSSQLQSH